MLQNLYESQPGTHSSCLSKSKGLGRARRAFTLVEIMIVILVIGILLGIAIPGWLKARAVGRARACQENLAKIDGAKEQYAIENNIAQGESIPGEFGALVGAELYLKKTPFCPASGNYNINSVGADPSCDYAAPAYAPKHEI
ncbi:MAG: competence type IV pilus major pilin ComGC [Candidatus Sumerlaeia bacterium]